MNKQEILDAVNKFDETKMTVCQVVGSEPGSPVWNCNLSFHPAGEDGKSFNSFNVITVCHPQLKRLPTVYEMNNVLYNKPPDEIFMSYIQLLHTLCLNSTINFSLVFDESERVWCVTVESKQSQERYFVKSKSIWQVVEESIDYLRTLSGENKC